MFVKVATVSEVKPDTVHGVVIDGKNVALYLLDGQIRATTDVCPHQFCLLSSSGEVYQDEGSVECACHGSHFDIVTGEPRNPPASDPLEIYAVEVRGDEVFVDL